ncbi:MAG: creatininase family protein [Salinivirgaceae bacterium]|jgi:creatinine amidohydrolase
MKKFIVCFLFVFPLWLSAQQSDNLAVKWEELTTPDFVKAVSQSGKVCILPIGVVEKHGPHMPLGTDLINIRATVFEAVKQEYAVVFPEYYVSQINEARHQPGVIAYSPDLIWKMLLETCDEIARNGFEKIIFVNGHGGNGSFLPYFCMSLLSEKRDYAVYLFQPAPDSVEHLKVEKLMNKLSPEAGGGHAGATETSFMMAVRPDLIKMNEAETQSGEDQNHLPDLNYSYTGIWWYAKFPNHYFGHGKYATPELGQAMLTEDVSQLVKMIREVKTDTKVLELQKEFYERSEHPIDTK